MGLSAVAKPGVHPSDAAVRGWEEAMTHAPEGYENEALPMFPSSPLVGRCRICGQTRKLTREHVPPAVVDNKGQYRTFTLDDWFNRGEGQLGLGTGSPGQGGIWGYTLCKSCNDLTGQRYVREFKAWWLRAGTLLNQVPSPREVDLNPEPFGVGFQFGSEHDGGVAPGDFVRQVLACMCTLAGPWNLTDRHPTVRHIILDGAPSAMPEQLRLHLCFCWGPRIRLLGPQLSVNAVTGEWAWLMEMAYPPLAMMMVLASNHEVVSEGVDITSFTEIEPRTKVVISVDEPIIAGFTWSPYAWDYRSSAALGAESPIPDE